MVQLLVMVQLLALERKPRSAIRQEALTLCRADGRAQIGLARETRRALAALGCVEGNDVIPLLHARNPRTDINHDAGTLLAKNGREQPFGVCARQRELVGVAD